MAYFRKRANGWEYRISYKDNDGKYKQLSKSGFKTKSLAQRAAAVAESEYLKGNIIDKSISFYHYFVKWSETYKKPKVARSTYQTYIDSSNIIKKAIGLHIKLTDMTPTSYQEILNELGKQYAKGTLIRFHHQVKASLKHAVHDGIIYKNFAELATVTSEKEGMPNEEKFLEDREYEKLIRDLRTKTRYRRYMFIYIVANTGMRYGEAKALSWNDIDLENHTVTINKSFSERFNDMMPTKNKQSNRTIPLNNRTVIHLKQFKKLHPNEEYPFMALRSYDVNVVLKKIVGRSVHIHSLRHTYASYLIAKQVDIMTISRLLGHKDTTTTLKVYAHQLEQAKKRDDKMVQDIFSDI